MPEETLAYLEQVLSGLRSRYAAGDKSVESKLRAIAAKIDQIKLQKDLVKPTANTTKEKLAEKLAGMVNKRRRSSCCR